MTDLTRRAALKVLGVLPAAAAFGTASAQPPAAQPPATPHTMPNQPATATQPPASATKRQFFTAKEWRMVSVLADDIIPRDAHSGSATEAGVPAYLDYNLSVPEESDTTRLAIRGGLQWLDRESRTRFGRGYATASAAQRHGILDDISWPEKARPEMSAGVAFFGRFRDMVASGFFSSAIGWKDVRYIGNTFNPGWDGCPPEALKKLGVNYDMMKRRG